MVVKKVAHGFFVQFR